MTAISRNVYFDVFDDIVNKYNNTVHKTIKTKPILLRIIHILIQRNKLMIKILNLRLVIKLKNVFAKGYTSNWSEEVFVVSKIKSTAPWTYVINDLNGEEIPGTFYEKKTAKD